MGFFQNWWDAANAMADLPNTVIDTAPGPGAPPRPLTPAEIQAIFDQSGIDAHTAWQDMNDLLGSPAGTDADGNPAVATGIYADIAGLPTFTEWMATNGAPVQNDPYAEGGAGKSADAIAALIAQLSPDSPEARAYAAAMAGFEDIENADGSITTAWEQRQDFVQSLTDIVGAGEGAGMSPEDMALREKANRRNVAAMEERAARMIADSKSETGSTGRMFMKADESLNQIADVEMRQQVQLASDNRNLAFQQYQAAVQGLDTQLQSGQITTTGYVDTKRMALGEAMAGYFKEADQILQQNEERYRQAQETYRADYDAVLQQINISFQAIQMEMGLLMGELQYAADLALQALAPQYAGYDLAALADAFTLDFSDVVDLISSAAEIIDAVVPG